MASMAFDRHLKGFVAWTFLTGVSVAQSPSTIRVSVDSSGAQANGGYSFFSAVSADGRFVAFASYASNLVPGDTNGQVDMFVRDTIAGTTERVSVSSAGAEGDNWSDQTCAISADGRFVAFQCLASNLVPNDTNGRVDVFVRDRQAGTTELVSIGPSGSQEIGTSMTSSISADGRYVLFSYFPPSTPVDELRIRDRQTATTEVLHPTQEYRYQGTDTPKLSADGRYVAFDSIANGSQVSVYDRQTATTEIVSVAGGSPGNGSCVFGDISADGRYVVFWSTASNLVPGDTNGCADIFVRDRQVGATSRVSISAAGAEGNANSWYGASISADGRYVAFESEASNLVSGDTNLSSDVFLRDRQAGTTSLLSVDTAGVQGNAGSYEPVLSADGRFVGFSSTATNLVPADTNAASDIFLRDRGVPPPETYCTAKVNSLGCTPSISYSGLPSISGPDNFYLTASNVLNNKTGLMFWGGASANVPFFGGTRCVASPIIRTHGQNSGGNPPPNDCTGAYSFHFSQSYMASHSLTSGETVYAQFWSRDPGFPVPNNIGLTDGLQFVIGP